MSLVLVFLFDTASAYANNFYYSQKKEVNIQFSYDKKSISFKALPKKYRIPIKNIITKYSIFRRISSFKMKTSKKIYLSLLANLPLAAKISKEIGIGDYSIKTREENFLLFNDNRGIQAKITPVIKTKNKLIFYGNGFYRGKRIKNLSGEVVLILFYSFDEKKSFVLNDMHFYMKFENPVMSTFVKVFSYLFNPLLRKRVNRYLLAVKTVCEEMLGDPQRLYAYLKEKKEITAKDLYLFKQIVMK